MLASASVETDLELLGRWQLGDRAAGSELFKRHFDSLYRFFANKLPDEVEDLIQATWLACVRYGDSVAKAASFRAYVFTVARNELYRCLRLREPDKEVDFGASSIVDFSPSPLTILDAVERDTVLLAALRTLPVDLQIVLELHYWEDLSATELAEVLEVPVGTAKTRIRRAKQLLTEALARREAAAGDDGLDRWIRSVRAKIRKH